jgi:hypothetical protein
MPVGGGTRRGGDVDFFFCSIENGEKGNGKKNTRMGARVSACACICRPTIICRQPRCRRLRTVSLVHLHLSMNRAANSLKPSDETNAGSLFVLNWFGDAGCTTGVHRKPYQLMTAAVANTDIVHRSQVNPCTPEKHLCLVDIVQGVFQMKLHLLLGPLAEQYSVAGADRSPS